MPCVSPHARGRSTASRRVSEGVRLSRTASPGESCRIDGRQQRLQALRYIGTELVVNRRHFEPALPQALGFLDVGEQQRTHRAELAAAAPVGVQHLGQRRQMGDCRPARRAIDVERLMGEAHAVRAGQLLWQNVTNIVFHLRRGDDVEGQGGIEGVDGDWPSGVGAFTSFLAKLHNCSARACAMMKGDWRGRSRCLRRQRGGRAARAQPARTYS